MKMGIRITKEIKEEMEKRPKCPECGSLFMVKDVKQWGKQTYLCIVCYRRFTPNAKHVFIPKPITTGFTS
jgi:ribosomal protein L37AE/L43A